MPPRFTPTNHTDLPDAPPSATTSTGAAHHSPTDHNPQPPEPFKFPLGGVASLRHPQPTIRPADAERMAIHAITQAEKHIATLKRDLDADFSDVLAQLTPSPHGAVSRRCTNERAHNAQLDHSNDDGPDAAA